MKLKPANLDAAPSVADLNDAVDVLIECDVHRVSGILLEVAIREAHQEPEAWVAREFVFRSEIERARHLLRALALWAESLERQAGVSIPSAALAQAREYVEAL